MSVRAAVVGLGAMGRHHARILAEMPGAELVATCDADPARARDHARRHGCEALASATELPSDVEAVVVAVPTQAHREVAEPLLSRGVACLVEKPMAPSVEDADALAAAAASGRAALMVGHSERFNPALAHVRDAVHEPLFVEAHRLGVLPERSLDVDVVLDLMVHDLDLLFWMTGAELLDVQAIGVNVLTPRVDIANARLTFSSGCTANVTASRVSADMTRKLRLFQEDCYVSVDFANQTAEVARLESVEGRRRLVRDVRRPPEGEPRPEPLRLELEAFLAAVRGEAEPAVTAADGRRALDAALRVLASMEAEARRRGELRSAHRTGRGRADVP